MMLMTCTHICSRSRNKSLATRERHLDSAFTLPSLRKLCQPPNFIEARPNIPFSFQFSRIERRKTPTTLREILVHHGGKDYTTQLFL